MASVKMTNHSIKRTKERLGLSKKLADKNAEKAFKFGITRDETKGDLRRFLDKSWFSNGKRANNMRVYHHYVYCFQDNTLITVISLPTSVCKLADSIQKEREESC